MHVLPGLQRLSILLIFLLCLVVMLPAKAAIPGAGTLPGQTASTDAPSAGALNDSLSQVISTLENDQQRQALLESLKQLQQANEQRKDADTGSSGLLGALASSISTFDGQDRTGFLARWKLKAIKAGQDLTSRMTLSVGAGRLLSHFLMTISIWFGIGWGLKWLVRVLARYYSWDISLPEEPAFIAVLRYFLRRALPWSIAFGATLGIASLLPASAGITLGMVMAYVSLAGLLFRLICEIIFSLFGYGHRRIAQRLLRQRALGRLFVIGALAALGDAANADEVRQLVGNNLGSFLSEMANLAAVVITGIFIIRFKRPIRHLIQNSPYPQRKQRSNAMVLMYALGRIWHIPATLFVAALFLSVITLSGDARSAFAKAVFTAGLLVVVLIINGVIRRHREQERPRGKRRRYSLYWRRLSRFGYTVLQLISWVIFLEIALQLWGYSLTQARDPQTLWQYVAHSLLSLGTTLLLAWLVWIVLDTAIQQALKSTMKTHRGRHQSTRAQTIAPLIRNVVFVTISVITLIVVLANLGVNVTPLLAGAGVIGLAVGFGAQTLVQDLITGVFILIEDTLAIDDFVDVGGHMGTVEKLSIRTVRLRDLDGIVHSIPFSQIKSIQNYSREFGIALFRIRIPHELKIDDAMKMVQEVADELRQATFGRFYIWSPLEFQGIDSFDNGAAILRAQFRTSPVKQWEVAREFNLRLKRRMENDGINMAMSRMSIQMESGDPVQGAAPLHHSGATSNGPFPGDGPVRGPSHGEDPT
ncbi:mechanosensitive ion channel domain-containing protein [Larsenimonas rhizosphaerae]|uniref:Mechanosensitive ion channel n=1 Tax=Larsenimonas rhizosphaerae TaxID=2944682 RepID=A0AA42CUN2_9GAMM|nr:mechanosensitive ion channel domain-containing protein [Larsenimonas rhizosphaerae]MCX2524151.1 mechanosensitive ion channel [Larsenimonas rhizosphaerae]